MFSYYNLHYFQACKIVEGQRYTKRLNEKQITTLLKVTCQRPRDRENDILRVYLNLLFVNLSLYITVISSMLLVQSLKQEQLL